MNDHPETRKKKLFSFSIRDILLVLTIVAIAIAWWTDHYRKGKPEFDIPGPISVRHSIRMGSDSRADRNIPLATGIDFPSDKIVVHSNTGGEVLSSNNLIEFSWTRL